MGFCKILHLLLSSYLDGQPSSIKLYPLKLGLDSRILVCPHRKPPNWIHYHNIVHYHININDKKLNFLNDYYLNICLNDSMTLDLKTK